MAASMGSVMANWTSELIKQAKKKNRKKLKEQHRVRVEAEEAERRKEAALSAGEFL